MTEIPAVSVTCSVTTLVFQIDSLPTDSIDFSSWFAGTLVETKPPSQPRHFALTSALHVEREA
jgi:hypothetical protein